MLTRAFRGTEDPAALIRDYGFRVRMIDEKDFPLEEVRYLDVWTRLDRNTPSPRAVPGVERPSNS